MSEQSIDLSLATPRRHALPRIKGLWVFFALIAVMALLPFVASPYALLLLVPFFAYAIALFGFNLLFGTTGSCRSDTPFSLVSVRIPLRHSPPNSAC